MTSIANTLLPTKNMAIYNTASVAYGWAGAVMRGRKFFGKNYIRTSECLSVHTASQPQASGLAGWALGLAGWPRDGNG